MSFVPSEHPFFVYIVNSFMKFEKWNVKLGRSLSTAEQKYHQMDFTFESGSGHDSSGNKI